MRVWKLGHNTEWMSLKSGIYVYLSEEEALDLRRGNQIVLRQLENHLNNLIRNYYRQNPFDIKGWDRP